MIRTATPNIDVLGLLKLGLFLGTNPKIRHPGLQNASESGFAAVQRIGVGGTCEVWRGVQRATGNPVAIKVAKQDVLADKDAGQMFSQEKRILNELDRSIAPSLIAYSEHGLASFLVMEAIDGIPVDEAMSNAKPAHTKQIIRNMLGLLAKMHSLDVVHGDLKTNHLLVSGADMRLIDFGFSQFHNQGPFLLRGSLTGATEKFMAPELRQSLRPTKQSDVYSIGCILECLARQSSFSLRRILVRLAKWAKHEDVSIRPKSAVELLEKFDGWAKNRRRAMAAATATIFIGTTVVLGGTWQTNGPAHFAGNQDFLASPSHNAWVHALQAMDSQDAEVLHQVPGNRSATSIAVGLKMDRVAWGTSRGFVEVAHETGDALRIPLPPGHMLEALAWDDRDVLHAATNRKQLLAVRQNKWTQVGVIRPGTRFLQFSDHAWVGWDSVADNLYRFSLDMNAVKVVAPGVSAMKIANAPGCWLTIADTDDGQYKCEVIAPNGTELVTPDRFLVKRPPTACSYDDRTQQLVIGCGADLLVTVGGSQVTPQETEYAGPATALAANIHRDILVVSTSRLEFLHRQSGERISSVKLLTGNIVLHMSYDRRSGSLDVVTDLGWERWRLPRTDGGLAFR